MKKTTIYTSIRSILHYSTLGCLVIICFVTSSCSNYLDTIPDETSVKDLFLERNGVFQYFATCSNAFYSIHSAECDPGYLGGDEMRYYRPTSADSSLPINKTTEIENLENKYPALAILNGKQNAHKPYCNFWTGSRGGINLWEAIRNCNIFLQEIDNTNCVNDEVKASLKSRIYVLKAYYNLFLLRLYGPIPIMDKAIEAGEPMIDFLQPRKNEKEVVEYIVNLCEMSHNKDIELVANTIKAKALLWIAREEHEQGHKKEHEKGHEEEHWERAIKALRKAISLYQKHGITHENEKALEPSNNSKISVHQENNDINTNQWRNLGFIANNKTVNLFYTANGLPLDEDKTHCEIREPRFYKKLRKRTDSEDIYDILIPLPKLEKVDARKEELLMNGIWQDYSILPSLDELELELAEALNEYENSPTEEIYTILDLLRAENGLPHVRKAWKDFGIKANKPLNKDGLREIIHTELLIETAFTGKAFYLLRNWAQPINHIYTEKTYYRFFPIPTKALKRNPLLEQNKGW